LERDIAIGSDKGDTLLYTYSTSLLLLLAGRQCGRVCMACLGVQSSIFISVANDMSDRLDLELSAHRHIGISLRRGGRVRLVSTMLVQEFKGGNRVGIIPLGWTP